MTAQVHALRIEGAELRYRLVRGRRRHIRIRVEPDGLLRLDVPRACPRALAEAALRSHGRWALEAVAEVVRWRRPLTSGRELPWLGGALRLQVLAGARAGVRRVGDNLAVRVEDPADEGRLRGLLEAWYRREARRELTRRAGCWAPVVGAAPARICVRDQRSRWGSCSARGTVSLSWRLVLLEPELADYVVVHELCHLRQMNHSPAFWAAVEAVLPDWRARRAALRALPAAALHF